MPNTEKIASPNYAKKRDTLVDQLNEMMPEDIMQTFNDDADQLAKNHTDTLKITVGDKAPNFRLPNATGQMVMLSELLTDGPVVLTFYRGAWCPYCNLSLKIYQQVLPKIKEIGAQLVAISPQTPDSSLAMKEKNELEFEVLSDADNRVAQQFTTIFKNGDKPVGAMKALDIDFHSFYSADSGEIPVPATFIINQDGTVRFAKSEGGDYRKRVESADVLAALRN